MMSTNIVEQSHWDNLYKNVQFKPIPDDYFLLRAIDRHLDIRQGECFEVGAFPGNFQPFFGKRGLILNGIDLTPSVELHLPKWLSEEGYAVGQFKKMAFEDLSEEIKYDVVCSFGFIEHFTNFDEIVLKHARLVKDNGYLVIETPNMRGVYRLLYHLFYREDFERHVLESMNPKKWEEVIGPLGYEIKYSGFLGGIVFFFENPKMNWLQKMFARPLKKLIPYLNLVIRFESPYHSRCCLLIAKKIG